MKSNKAIIGLVSIVVAFAMLAVFGISGCAPAIDEPVVDEPVVDEPVVDEPVVDEPVVDEPVAEERAEDAWVIGFNNFADSHEFCYKVHEGIREAAEEHGVELLYTESEMDGTRMISNTQILIDQGADVVIDFNWIPEVGETMLEMCQEAGVELISMDTVYEGAYYFGVDGYSAGEVLGEYAEGVIKDRWDGEVEALVGIYYVGGGDLVLDRVLGFKDYLKEKAADLDMPDEDMEFVFDAGADEQTLDARDTITDFLTANPDLSKVLVVTHNDETGAGVFAGVELSGREDDVLLFSHGGDTPFHEHLRGGGGDVWVSSVAYAPETYGSQVIPMAIDILEGKDVPEFVFLDHFALHEGNIDEHYPVE